MLSPLLGHYCTAGMKIPCESGHYCPERGLKSQSECEAGFYCSTVTSQHQMCHPGNYSEARATECTPCQPGTEASFEMTALHRLTEISLNQHQFEKFN